MRRGHQDGLVDRPHLTAPGTDAPNATSPPRSGKAENHFQPKIVVTTGRLCQTAATPMGGVHKKGNLGQVHAECPDGRCL